MVAKRCPPRAWFIQALLRLSMMILRRHQLRRRRSHQLRLISISIKVRFLHRRITRRRRKKVAILLYPRRRQKERRPPPLSRPKAHEALKACVCCVSSFLSSLCDETEVVKKSKKISAILAGKKIRKKRECQSASGGPRIARCVVGMVFLLLLRF